MKEINEMEANELLEKHLKEEVFYSGIEEYDRRIFLLIDSTYLLIDTGISPGFYLFSEKEELSDYLYQHMLEPLHIDHLLFPNSKKELVSVPFHERFNPDTIESAENISILGYQVLKSIDKYYLIALSPVLEFNGEDAVRAFITYTSDLPQTLTSFTGPQSSIPVDDDHFFSNAIFWGIFETDAILPEIESAMDELYFKYDPDKKRLNGSEESLIDLQHLLFENRYYFLSYEEFYDKIKYVIAYFCHVYVGNAKGKVGLRSSECYGKAFNIPYLTDEYGNKTKLLERVVNDVYPNILYFDDKHTYEISRIYQYHSRGMR